MNKIITHLIFMKFKYKSTKGILNFKQHIECHFDWTYSTCLSQYGKQSFSENRVQIGASVRLEICSLTDTQTNCNKNITPQRFRGGVKKYSNQHFFK